MQTILHKLNLTFFVLVFAIGVSQAQIINQPYLYLDKNEFSKSLCENENITATVDFQKQGAWFRWLKDGNLYREGEENHLSISEPGIYEVGIIVKDEHLESNKVIVEQCPPKQSGNTSSLTSASISCDVPVICGSTTSATLQASPNGTGYTFQWYYGSSYNGTYTALSGATSAQYDATQAGYYKVSVNDGVTAPALSNSFQVYDRPFAKISDMNGNYFSTINSSPNTAVQLKVEFIGGAGPYTFTYYDSEYSSVKSVTTTSNPYFFTVTPEQNSRYYLNDLITSCNSSPNYNGHYGSIRIVVDASTAFSFSTPSKTNVCAGETIDLPYNTAGTWKTGRRIMLELIDVNGTYVSNSYHSNLFNNPLKFTIPSELPVSSGYKVRAYVEVPHIPNSIVSTFTINVTSTGCSPRAVINVYPRNEGCGYVYLSAIPNTSGNTYTWYKDNNVISGATSANYAATESGNYKVTIQNSGTGYNSTSTSSFPISIISQSPVISSTNPTLCGTNTAVTINSNITNSSYSYQWQYRSPNSGNSTNLSGETSSSITTSTPGYYMLKLTTNQCVTYSNEILVTDGPQIRLTNSGNTTNSVTVNSGQSTTLKVHFSGEMPFLFSINSKDGTFSKNFYATTNPYSVTITPNQSQYYSVSGSNSCGYATSINSILVNVAPTPSFTLGTPSNTTLCLGGYLEVPYTTSGTWGDRREFVVRLVDNSGNTVPNSYSNIYTISNSLLYPINQSISPGTYKLMVYAFTPNNFENVQSSYNITVNSSGCSVPDAKIVNGFFGSGCSSYYLRALPEGNYTYQWYKDGTLVSTNSGYNAYNAYSNGNYTVTVSNTSGYSSTSAIFNISSITTPSNSLSTSIDYCGSPNTLSAGTSLSGNTYQWYFSPTSFGYTSISGATSSTYTTTQTGSYRVIVKNGDCEYIKTFECPLLINFVSKTVCQQSAILIPINSYYSNMTLKLLNAGNNAEIMDLDYTSSNNGLLVTLPNSITTGTYKFKAVVTGQLESAPSNGILTVSSSVAANAPVITATPSSYSGSSHTINLSAANCSGILNWVAGATGSSNPTTYTLFQRGALFQAYCSNSTSGCNSKVGSTRVYYECGDTNEPNDNKDIATSISGDTYTSSSLCFDFVGDEDWFSTIINGRKYYIRAKLYSTYSSFSQPYKLVKTLSGDNLTIQTQAVNSGAYLDTYLYLYDDSGNELARDDEGNGNGLSKIIYQLLNPCRTNVTLSSTEFDILQNETSVIRANYITGENKIFNTANAAYEASNAITLPPGFETQISSSGVFKAEIKPCN